MKISLFILALLCSICSFGQLSIKGTITDGQQNLPAVTDLLLGLDSAFVKGVVTDSTGEFIFKNVAPGYYLISASMVGYSRFFSLRISAEDENIIIGKIILEEAATELDEITLSGEKQLFDQKIDRLVINIESSITSSGNTILEVLQKSPLYNQR